VARPGTGGARAIQFEELKHLCGRRIGEDYRWQLTPWTPPKSGPNEPQTQPITSKWIYAFQTGYVGNSAIATLSREIWIDQAGNLSFVDGAKRRHAEPDAAPKPTPADGVPFALSVQRDYLHYVFIATRGRLFRSTIGAIERLLAGTPGKGLDLNCMFRPQSLYAQGKNGPVKAIAVDPLTLVEALNREYQKLRNVAMNFSIPNDKDPHFKTVQLDVARYQLAKLIDESLLRGDRDPEGVAKGLVNGGDWMRSQIIQKHETEAAQLDETSNDAAGAIAAFLSSKQWEVVKGWYGVGPTGPKNEAAGELGHILMEAEATAIQRLIETRRGQVFLRGYLEDSKGPRSWFFAPEDKNDKSATQTLQDWYPVFRRGAMAGALFWAELMPAAIVLRMFKNPREVMERTFEIYFDVAQMERVTANAYGVISERLEFAEYEVYERINYRQAKEDIKEWLEHGQPKWPEGTIKRAASDLVEHIFIGVEVANLALKLQDLLEQTLSQNKDDKASRRIVVMKAIAGMLDLAVASQEPIREWAHGLKTALIVVHAGDAAKHAAGAAAHGAGAAGEHEGGGIIARMTSPAAFKLLGVLPAVIDLVVHSLEGEEAWQEGQTGVAFGHGVVILGSAMSFVGSLGAGTGIAGQVAALTAGSLGLLVVGTAVMMLGYILVDELEKSEWRLYAENCIYGYKSPWPKSYLQGTAAKQEGDKEQEGPERGDAIWSAGDFGKWTGDLEGVQLQSKVLSALLSSLRIVGTGSCGSCAVSISFGAIPPSATLQIQFSLTLTDGRTLDPGYMIDLNNGKVVNTWRALGLGHAKPSGEDSITNLVFKPDYPDNVQIDKASCAVVMNYGKQNANDPDVATGTVPIRGQLIYEILKGCGRWPNTEEVSTLKMKTK
jgi:hypothetical protein